jgi:thymidine kinase
LGVLFTFRGDFPFAKQITVSDASEALALLDSELLPEESLALVAVDEANFFAGDGLVEFASALREQRPLVSFVAAGLDLDFRREPFGPLVGMAAAAEARAAVDGLGSASVEMLTSICSVCGAPATFSSRLDACEGVVAVGGQDLYAPTCETHHVVPDA